MPIENERKFVIQGLKHSDLDQTCFRSKKIRQGYFNGKCRVREIDTGQSLYHYFTFKCNTEQGLVEIEQQITIDDFNRLWPETRDRLEKTRFSEYKPACRNFLWEIDFFGDLDDPYFVLAECEIYNGYDAPGRLIDEVEKHVTYRVARDDKRFTSRKLADEAYARSLLQPTLFERVTGVKQ